MQHEKSFSVDKPQGQDRRFLFAWMVIATALLLLLQMLFASVVAADTGILEARQRELLNLLRNDCGACHGMTMKGGLGLPLTPEALRDKDFNSLVLTILDGRPGTPMPPWRRFLTENEARWMVQQLQHGLPSENNASLQQQEPSRDP